MIAAALAKTHPNVSRKTISKTLSDGSKETYCKSFFMSVNSQGLTNAAITMISDPETKHEIVVRRIEAADSMNCRFHYSLRLINRVKYCANTFSTM
jgi:hypothetical protein